MGDLWLNLGFGDTSYIKGIITDRLQNIYIDRYDEYINSPDNWMKNYIVRSYRDVIVVTKIATRRSSKTQSIVMY